MSVRELHLPKIRPGESVFIVGPKGSGKTVLAKVLLLSRRNAIVLDTKLIERWGKVGVRVAEKNLLQLRGGRFHWPASHAFILDKDVQDAIFRGLLANGHRTLYVDEAYDLQLSGGLKLVATQGRAIKLGLWISTQRPSHIPLFLISEAQHFFIFYLRLKRDRERVEEATGVRIPWERLQRWRHSFLYVSERGGLLGPIKLDEASVKAVL